MSTAKEGEGGNKVKHVRFVAGDKVTVDEPCEFEFVTHKGHGYVRLPKKVKATIKKKDKVIK